MSALEDALQDVFGVFDAAGWEVDEDLEGGQPNGSGELEPSSYREWFTEARETHHRRVITITGPWLPGSERDARAAGRNATEEELRARLHARRVEEARAELRAAAREEERAQEASRRAGARLDALLAEERGKA